MIHLSLVISHVNEYFYPLSLCLSHISFDKLNHFQCFKFNHFIGPESYFNQHFIGFKVWKVFIIIFENIWIDYFKCRLFFIYRRKYSY